jgi:hypothetical protein
MKWWLIRKLLGREATPVVWSLRETAGDVRVPLQYKKQLWNLAERFTS